MSVEFSPDRRDELCNNLVEVNPDVTGLGVVIAMLWHSILIEVITVIMCMLSKGTEHRRYEGYREALYRICGVLYATFFAQLVGSLIIFDDLTFDQRFLIAATQVIATVQIISSGIIFAETLNSAHIVLCIVESALSFAYGAMAMRHDNRPLEKQCLASYWPSALSTSTLRPDILAMIGACFWVIGLACTCLKVGLYGPSGFHKHSKKEYPKTYKDLGAPKVLVIGTAICWIVMVYFTITTYTSAAHLKRDASDQELWTFGQILALCTIGTSVWQLVWCIIQGNRKDEGAQNNQATSTEVEKGAGYNVAAVS